MVNEILSIPEEYLAEVIAVIRAGLDAVDVTPAMRERLTEWCDDEEDYIRSEPEESPQN